MRSLPLLEAALLVLLFGVIMVPVLRLTNARPPAPHASEHDAPVGDETTGCYATIRAAHPPEVLTILHESTTLLTITNPPPTIDAEWRFPAEYFSPTGLELEVRANWAASATPLATETAIEITLEPDTHGARSAILWTSGPAEDFLPFIWD